MPKIWRNRIIAGDQSFDRCPLKYKNAVRELLKDDVTNGVITAEDYERFTLEEYQMVIRNSFKEGVAKSSN